MPRFERTEAGSGPLVRGFGGGGTFIVDEGHYRALLLTPALATGWDPPPLADLSVDHLAEALALNPAPEFILLGTGSSMARPPLTLVRELEGRGIGVEAMDSRAAARAWGVLRAEERWIAAALLPL